MDFAARSFVLPPAITAKSKMTVIAKSIEGFIFLLGIARGHRHVDDERRKRPSFS